MQSIIQYYSFRKNLRAQLHRHGGYDGGLQDSKGQNGPDGQEAGHTHSDTDVSDDVPVEAGEPLRHSMTGVKSRVLTDEEKFYVVGYEGPDDELNPHNWSYTKRWVATILIAYIGFIVGLASSIDAPGLAQAAQAFNVSEVAESLATGMYLIGFGVGSLVAGPFSEDLGRNLVYLGTLIIYMIFVMASALAPNYAAQIIFRFLAGFFGATPLVVAGGSMSDLWIPMERTYAFPVFANAAFLGPVLGGTVGGYITQSYLGFRWNDWITLIWSASVLILVFLFQPETYAPVLLRWKAQHLRRITGNEKYRAAIELHQVGLGHRLLVSLYRPFQILFRELIVVLIALYITVIYIILFGFFSSFTFIFGQVHNFTIGQQGLAFVGIAVGLCLCSLTIPLVYMHYKRTAEASGGHNPPESRLLLSMYGGWTIPVSLFWMGWTDYPDISVWSPLASTILFGFGILSVFNSCYQYIIDVYEINAASALASFTLLRYVASGVMILVSIPLYKNLGVQWACTLLALLSAVCVPVPFALYKYGPLIRSKYSTYAAK